MNKSALKEVEKIRKNIKYDTQYKVANLKLDILKQKYKDVRLPGVC